MRILSVSDVIDSRLYPHIDRQRLGAIDLVLACGDLPPEYLSYLRDVLEAPLYYVCGNHDLRYRQKSPAGCQNLHARLETVNNLNLLGLEGSRWYNGGPFQYSEKAMQAIIRRLHLKIWWRKGLDLVISHAPPRQIHDQEDPCHRGFRSFNTLIRRYRPRIFIHGHIHRRFEHPEERITLVQQTQVINTYGHFVFEIDPAAPAR
jgi:Icc-related predicted phosphoesterase